MRLIDADALVQWCEDDLRADIESKKYNKVTEIMGNGVIDYLKNAVIPKQPTIGDGDITPEQVIAAYNVIREMCINRRTCGGCIFARSGGWCTINDKMPEEWPELEANL